MGVAGDPRITDWFDFSPEWLMAQFRDETGPIEQIFMGSLGDRNR